MAEINKRVRDIADQVKDSAVFSNDFVDVKVPGISFGEREDKTHVNFQVKDEVYISNLPEGITAQTLVDLKKYNGDFEAGFLLGIGEKTLKLMEEYPEITSSTSISRMSLNDCVTTLITINNVEHAIEAGYLFDFKSHIRERMPNERVTGETTQRHLVQQQLKDLYIQTLCEPIETPKD